MNATESSGFGERLRRLREAAGLTQEELAERSGLTAKAIGALERGERRRPYPTTVRALAEALGLSPDERTGLLAAVPARTLPAAARPAAGRGAGNLRPWLVDTAPLLGRDEEVDVLRDQLLQPEVRLLTIVGPGGVGKTRLAATVARSLLADPAFPDGVWFVDLSVATTRAAVMSMLARAFDLTDPATTGSLAGLEGFLAPRQLLVVLDNFEQVLDAAQEVGRLIAAYPGMSVLVTSREPLRLRWERTLPLMPLALPDPRHLPAPAELEQIPAVGLFLERARAVEPRFQLREENARAIAELCVRLDGLPLAIELVAARAAQLGPAATLDRLTRRLPVPGPGLRDMPPRQQSLRATFDWSLELLDEPERQLFRRMGVFAGGWTLQAAEAVAGPRVTDVLAALASLADKSLTLVEAGDVHEGDNGLRFRMLDTARSHALDLLEAGGEIDEARLAHVRHFARMAEESGGQLEGAERAATVARLEREEDNFRLALEWARTSRSQDALEEGLRLVGALAWYWFLHGYPPEARDWFDALLGPEPEEPVSGDDSRRRAILRSKALNAAGFRATDQGEYELAAMFHGRALATWRRLHDIPGIVMSLHGVGDTALWLGDTDLAQQSYDEGLELARTEGTTTDVALFAFHLGQLAWLTGRLDAAERHAEEAFSVAQSAGNTTWPPYALFVLASVAHERGDVARAGRLYREAVGRAWEHHDRLGVRMALPGLASLAGPEGDPERAVRLAGVASALEENAGIWAFPPIRERHERWQREADDGLDPVRRAGAWEAGRTMSIDEAIAYALEVPAAVPATRPARGLLSEREREVLELLARGRSNREIARSLFVTEHTAKYHVASLFNKLGATSRAEAVVRAVARGLLVPPTD